MSNAIYQNVALSEIKESASNPRQHFDAKGLAELTESIKAKGVVNPLLLRPMSGHYEVVDGARRLRAAKAAGLATVPAVLRNMDDEEASEIQVVSNLQRQDVHPLDEAEGYKRLLDTKRYDVAALAAKMGKSSAYIHQRLALNGLIDEAKKALWSEKLSLGSAILIARVQPADQKQMVQGATQYGWSTNDVRNHIEEDILCTLDAAAFDKKDPLLVSKAGACTACMKRSGANKELFNDITTKDRCTDPACFNAKVKAHLTRVEKDLAAKGTKVVKLSAQSHTYTKGLIDEASWSGDDGWRHAKKDCPKPVQGLVVEGQGVGRLLTVCLDVTCKVCNPKNQGRSAVSSARSASPAARYKRRMEIHENRIEQAYRDRVYGELLKIISGSPTRSHLIMIIAQINNRWSGHLPEIGKMVGLKLPANFPDTLAEWTKYFTKATDANLLQLICGIIMRQDLISDVSMGHDDAERMNALLALHNTGQIDTKALRADVTKDLEPKKPKPPKADPKPKKEKKP